jgi:hypothetical protein
MVSDDIVDTLERSEKRLFAHVVFVAKVITWTALLLIVGIIESGVVIKVFRVEFGASAHAKSPRSPYPETSWEPSGGSTLHPVSPTVDTVR